MNRRLSRASFLRALSGLLAVGALEACAPAAAPTPTPAAAPKAAAPAEPTKPAAEAPKPAEPTKPAAEAPKPAEPTKPAVATKPAAEPTKPAVAPAGPAKADKVKLDIFTSHSPKEKKEYDLMTSEYTKLRPNVEFGEVAFGTSQDPIEALLARLAGGNAPDVAIVFDSPVSLAVRGAMQPLDDLMKTAKYSSRENWPAGVIASCIFKDKTFGFPVMSAVYAMYFNQEWFEKQALPSKREDFPKKLDELRRVSKQFTKWDGDKLESAGFIPLLDSQGPEMWPMWVALNGGKDFDSKELKHTLDAEPNVALMDFVMSWLDEEYKGDYDKVTKSLRMSFGPKEGQPAPAFQTQRLATLVGGNFNALMYKEFKPQFTRWEVARFPTGPQGNKVVAGYWPNYFTIPTGAKHKEEAFNWIDWLNGDGIRYWFATIPDMPTNKKFPQDILPQILVDNRGKEFAQSFQAFFREQLDITTEMWSSPVQGFETDQVKRALERIHKKAAKPKDALAEAQKATQAELEKVLKNVK
ncbi:MAG TPA: extracellular solute-binding protein [Chloroflexota bacterium]|jgi:multiple sugar transport system substrate-binding protein|nr:extracellular solute-binding protein [Chloroflexota bacterium]